MPGIRRKVIVVTDGDRVAGRTVETAARNIGARFISLTTGNPTPLSGPEVVRLIKMTPQDPVVVMVDDRGKRGFGRGEQVLRYLAEHPDIEVLGAVAVASNTDQTEGVLVDKSVTRECRVIPGPVDKMGFPEEKGHRYLEGDTVDILNRLNVPVIIGTGDTGKMDFFDDCLNGAPVTTRALREILDRSGNNDGNNELNT